MKNYVEYHMSRLEALSFEELKEFIESLYESLYGVVHRGIENMSKQDLLDLGERLFTIDYIEEVIY